MIRTLFTGLGLAALLAAPVSADTGATSVQGLWRYTGLTSSQGKDMPLTGIFLLADGKFLQQAVFDGEPYSAQVSMAHSGIFESAQGGIHLVADQTLSLAPAGEAALSDAGRTEHDLAVTLDGEHLKLVFGSGTVQTLDRIGGASSADIYRLEKGMLAFADGYFVLVSGDGNTAVTGYGTYEQDGAQLQLEVIRWTEGAQGLAQNLRDVTLSARFDGNQLVLADGRTFTVAR